jgi:hypothetical protein
MVDDEVNDATIENGDLIFFSSETVPFIVFFGVSHTYNKLFDQKIHGLIEIEKALNQHLRHHPVKIRQEMNMIKYQESSIKFSDMGYIYTSNQEILNANVQNSENSVKIKEYFQFDNSKERNRSLMKILANKFRSGLLNLVNEFMIILTPNNSLDDLNDPKVEKLKKLQELHNEFLDIINGYASVKRINFSLILFIIKNLTNAKSIANYYIKDLILDSYTNMLVNSFIFDRPSMYFPSKVEVPVDEFVEMYKIHLIQKVFWIRQNKIIKGTFIEKFREALQTMANRYKTVLKELGINNWENYSDQFYKKLYDFSKQINTNRFFITPSMHIRIKNAITSYLIVLNQNPRFEKVNLFRESSAMINVYALNQVYQVFSVDRNDNAGFAVKTPVFEILSDNEQDSNNDDERLL